MPRTKRPPLDRGWADPTAINRPRQSNGSRGVWGHLPQRGEMKRGPLI